MKYNFVFSILSALTLMFLISSCAKKNGFEVPNSEQASTYNPGSDSSDSEEDGQIPDKAPTTPDSPKVYPLLWEAAHPKGKSWTEHVTHLIEQEAPHMIQGAADITTFCPRYSYLNTKERVNLWGLLISAIVKYESNFSPTSRMLESTMGIDPVTGKRVYSEGLMQLSYQDVKNYPFCDEFDWNRDKHLKPTDPRKTILDPYKNLSCGVRILAQQIRNRDRITLSTGVYWAVIKVNGKYSKIEKIAALTKKMRGCMN